jgi:hypothetical protein
VLQPILAFDKFPLSLSIFFGFLLFVIDLFDLALLDTAESFLIRFYFVSPFECESYF